MSWEKLHITNFMAIPKIRVGGSIMKAPIVAKKTESFLCDTSFK